MKKSLLSLQALLFTCLLAGQATMPTTDEVKQFIASRTCIVLEDDPFSAYNQYIKDAVKIFWKLTPYEFIDGNTFNVRRLNPAYSFIVLTETNFEGDKTNSVFNFINLLQGKDVEKLAQMPEICAVPLSYAGEDDFVYSYKLGSILEFIQNHALLVKEDPTRTGRDYLKYYNENIPDITKKTILIRQEDLTPDIATIGKIKAICPYKIIIATEDEIMEAIGTRAANTVFLHKVGPVGERKGEGYCFKMFIGTDDAKVYYYDLHSISKSNPNGLLPSDLKRLSRKW
jgi:hypothetical protein